MITINKDFRAAERKLEASPVFSIPWFHNVVLLQKVKDPQERLWYAQKSQKFFIIHGFKNDDVVDSKKYEAFLEEITGHIKDALRKNADSFDIVNHSEDAIKSYVRLVRELPEALKPFVPSVEAIEKMLSNYEMNNKKRIQLRLEFPTLIV